MTNTTGTITTVTTTPTRPSASLKVGERFGSLVVTELDLRLPRTPSQIEKNLLGERAARALCDCGSERVASAAKLINGRIKACAQCYTRRADPSPDAPRGIGRKAQVIDCAAFADIMAEAMIAYRLDPELMIKMAASGRRIGLKRLQWKARLDLREAESAARASCAASELTSCERVSPCATGSCPWAPPEFAHIDVAPVPVGRVIRTRAQRPQPRVGPGFEYTIEAAVQVLIEERTHGART